MHRVKFLKIIFLLGFFACKPPDERPRNLLPEKKVIEIMVDIHIFEAMAQERKLWGDSLSKFIQTNYDEMYRKHGISREEFLRTIDYYEHNPGKMDEIMTKVIDELSKLEAEVAGKEEKKQQE